MSGVGGFPVVSASTRREFLGASLAVLAASAADASPATGVGGTSAARGSGGTLRFFPGFEPVLVSTPEATIRGVMGGSGPPLLLLHGYPQTHLEWHRIASRLAERFTVVATDLRGYGDSSKPPGGPPHAAYAKRAMAADQVEVMRQLGFERFAVVGHDRGGRVAHRMALDHPERVTHLAVLDIVPTHHLYMNVTREFASAYYHWFFLIQPAPLPETLYGSNADFVLRRFFRGLDGEAIPEAVYSEYLRCFSDPATLHAMCEDYRAAAGIDLQHDEADLERRIECPLLAIWGEHGAMHRLYDVLSIWRERGTSVTGFALPGGHWLPEQLPQETFGALLEFLRD
jgi:haloacetate dehalogenase